MKYMEISFEIQGGQKLARLFPVMLGRVDDLTEPMKDSADFVLTTNRQTFESEGYGWRQLAPATVKDRERKGYPGAHPILVRAGTLKRSLSQRGAEGNVYEVGKDFMRAGSVLSVGGWNLAMIHQQGTNRIPARPIIGLDIGNLRRGLSRIWEMYLYHIPAELERGTAAGRMGYEMENLFNYSISIEK